MPIIPYTASKFRSRWGSALSGNHHLTVTWNEIVWAAMTMGKPGIAFLFSHGWHSISDLIARSHTVYANLRENDKHIEKSSLYVGLDPTEKGGVSYFMGMIAAKILGARLLDTPWLFHLSLLKSSRGAIVLKDKSEPDLAGLRNDFKWIVAEVKGRSSRHDKSAMATAKEQTRQLRSINGKVPSLRVAIQASFNPRLQWAIEDPDEFDNDAPDLQVDTEKVMEMYYSAVTLTTDNGQSRFIGNRKFIVRELPEIGVTIGIDHEVRNRLTERTMSRIEQPLSPEQTIEPHLDGEFSVFSDGLAISLDERWTEGRMAQDPLLRHNN